MYADVLHPQSNDGLIPSMEEEDDFVLCSKYSGDAMVVRGPVATQGARTARRTQRIKNISG